MMRRLAVALLCLVAAGCSVPIGRFTAVGDPARSTADDGAATPTPTMGQTCRWWILGVTLGTPRVEDAVADALERAGARGVLTDAALWSDHPFYGVAGKHCYTITGTAWRTPNGSDGVPVSE